MRNGKIISAIQRWFGVTKGEIIFAALMLGGLIIGLLYKINNSEKETALSKMQQVKLYASLDSLAEARRTTYIGTDLDGNIVPELAKGDTIVKPEFEFPKSEKKKLPTVPVNINTASKTELMTLPGVGEKTAVLIIDYRDRTPFRKKEDLMKIKGIGKKKLEKVYNYIVVE